MIFFPLATLVFGFIAANQSLLHKHEERIRGGVCRPNDVHTLIRKEQIIATIVSVTTVSQREVEISSRPTFKPHRVNKQTKDVLKKLFCYAVRYVCPSRRAEYVRLLKKNDFYRAFGILYICIAKKSSGCVYYVDCVDELLRNKTTKNEKNFSIISHPQKSCHKTYIPKKKCRLNLPLPDVVFVKERLYKTSIFEDVYLLKKLLCAYCEASPRSCSDREVVVIIELFERLALKDKKCFHMCKMFLSMFTYEIFFVEQAQNNHKCPVKELRRRMESVCTRQNSAEVKLFVALAKIYFTSCK